MSHSIPGAIHIFLPELEKRAGELKKKQPIAVYCVRGYWHSSRCCGTCIRVMWSWDGAGRKVVDFGSRRP